MSHRQFSNARFLVCAIGLVGLAVALVSPVDAKPRPVEEKDFELRKKGEEPVVFEVAEIGTIRARARVREPLPTTPVKLLLEGPGGLQVEKIGAAPLSLRYRVEEVERLGTWRLTVINVSRIGWVTGKVEIRFEPSGAPARGADSPPPSAGPPPTADPSPSADPRPSASPPPPLADAPPARETPPARDSPSSADAPLDGDAASEVQAAAPTTRPKHMAPVTDGRIVHEKDPTKLRAVCRDHNTDVFIRLDLARRTGGFYLRYNHVFDLALTQVGERVIEMRGSGEHPLYLDREDSALYFTSGEEGIFCRVRIYLGEG